MDEYSQQNKSYSKINLNLNYKKMLPKITPKFNKQQQM